ncbi:fibroblast growth factor receptor 4-like isoform X3 [Dendronephthya gigantea]|uniref:fibroblast growth factor receptor 4-like isoform X3 n=1 Tax=Dendronephthya gigantea TaxID=151771 RepID=UPI001069C809|nr:fibroblast growth factor receptor 4-like isoform X3 [Dendronephthya gigantea]
MLARFCFILCALFFVVESAFTRTPASPPLLYKYKSNVVALLGQSRVKLRCRVSNGMGAQYWWTRNGKKIRRSRKYFVTYFHNLRIKNVGASDAGEYVCRAKNDVGESHQTITLIVKDPAKENTTEERKPFFTHLEEMTKKMIIIPAGNKFKITCSASGRPSPTIAWYKNGKQLKLMPDGSTAIKPSDFILNFDSLRPKDDGKYTCFVSNKLGNVSASFDLTVKASPPPSFQSDVSNATVVLGESEVRLPCRVIADVNTEYWWTKGGKRITKRKRYRIKKFRYLRIKNVENSDAGEYVCRAKNNGGEIQQTITLIVEDPVGNSPEDRKPFFTHPKKMTKKMIIIPAGNKFKITCLASGRPSPRIAWYKNGKQLKRMPDGLTRIKPSDFVLNFESLRPKHDGKYTCIVSNKLGNVSASFDLIVKEIILTKPVLQKMENITAYEGDNVTFICRGYSDALPHFQWIVKNPKKNNSIEVLPSGLERDDYICDNKRPPWHCAKLLLLNVSREDERQYYCMAGDARGWSKETVWLKVLPRRFTPEEIEAGKPKFAPDSYVADIGGTVRLKCAFTDWRVEWTMTWQKYGEILQLPTNGRIQSVVGKSSFLVIEHAQKNDTGIYECVASNEFGTVKRELELTVQG